MKENIKHIVLSVLMLFTMVINGQVNYETVGAEAPVEEVYEEAAEDYILIKDQYEEKSFDSLRYEELKEDVDLIEEMEQKRLKEDSSQFGEGYGVEKGDSYTIYRYDSISGRSYYSERYRGSGERNIKDGVQPGAREYSKRKQFQRRKSHDRIENRKREIRDQKLKKKKEKNYKDDPRAEKIDDPKAKSKTGASDGFFKFLLIIIIAVILGGAAYMLFVDGPVEGGSSKILYDQEMNPDAVKLSELEIKINSAKEVNDFRSATRLYFVWVIKELSDKGFIQWKKRKTNYHYLLEVKSQSFSSEFEMGIKNYEFIWYGKYEVSSEEFELIENHFKELISNIK